MAALDDLGHLPIKKGEQQRADMGAVDIGVGHDDDLVVAQLGDVEAFDIGVAPDAGAKRGNQRADLGRGQHLVEAGTLHIQYFAAQRKHGLILAVPRLLGRTPGGIALDDEHLGAGRVAFLTFGKLARQARHVERPLSAGELARLARSLAGNGRLDHLADDQPGFVGMLLEPAAEMLAEKPFDDGPDFGGHQLILGLRGEFRVGNLDGKHAGQSFAGIIAGEGDPLLAGDPRCIGVIVDHASEPPRESRRGGCRRHAGECCW